MLAVNLQQMMKYRFDHLRRKRLVSVVAKNRNKSKLDRLLYNLKRLEAFISERLPLLNN